MAVALDRRASVAAGVTLPVVGALAPDIDAVVMPFGWDVYLRVHEAGTHSVVGVIVVAATLAGLFRWRTDRPFEWLFKASLISVAMHVALDVISGATIRLGWPFVLGRTSVGLVAMSDPWFIAPVAVAAVVALVSRWRLADLAPATLIVLAVLLAGKYVSRQAALATRGAAAGRLADAHYVEAEWGSLTGWWLYERVGERLRTSRLDAGGHEPRQVLEVAGGKRLLDGEDRLETVRNFLLAHELPVRVSRSSAGTALVFWSDLRFCWKPSDLDDPAPFSNVRPSAEPIACGVWFGGELDAAGGVLRQFVTLGNHVQAR